MAVSQDGRSLAVALETSADSPFPDAVAVYDVASGREQWRITADAIPAAPSRFIQPHGWHDDGRGVVIDLVRSLEGPAGLATAWPGGTVTIHDTTGWTYLAPSGRRVAEVRGSLGCMAAATHDVRITDLDSSAPLNTLHDETRTFLPWEWAPDSTELLVQARPYPSDPDEAASCQWAIAPPSWLLVATDGAPPRPVADPLAVLTRWYGGRAIAFECRGRVEPGYPRFGVLRAPDDCLSTSDPPATLLVGGETVAPGRSLQVIGIIDVGTAPAPGATP